METVAFKVTRKMVEACLVTEEKVHTFVTEASTFGLRPGQWPEKIEAEIGNGRPFYFERFEHDGQVAQYKQELGCVTLRIFND